MYLNDSFEPVKMREDGFSECRDCRQTFPTDQYWLEERCPLCDDVVWPIPVASRFEKDDVMEVVDGVFAGEMGRVQLAPQLTQ